MAVLKVIATTGFFLLLVSILIICYPQFYFHDKVEYKNFQVYYDKKIPHQIYAILDTVDQLIQKSEIFDPQIKFKIFLRSNENKYNTLPFQFPDKGMGQTTFITKNIFLYKSDITSNSTYNHIGTKRALSTTIAHEIIHVQ